MVFVVYAPTDPVSANAAEAMQSLLKFEDAESIGGMRHMRSGNIDLLELNTMHLYVDFLDDYIKNDTIIFLSRHGSIKNIAAFTVHPEGNWTSEAKLGGKPNELSVSSPIQMAKVLHCMKKNNKSDIPIVYEATHHGPLLNTPSFYAEIGGNEEIRASKVHANFLAKSVADSVDQEISYNKVAVGLGGLHYAEKFTRLTLENKYVFSHIMPRHYIENVGMIKQAIERSVPKAEIGIIEWKSLKAQERENVIGKLNELGLDYEKI